MRIAARAVVRGGACGAAGARARGGGFRVRGRRAGGARARRLAASRSPKEEPHSGLRSVLSVEGRARGRSPSNTPGAPRAWLRWWGLGPTLGRIGREERARLQRLIIRRRRPAAAMVAVAAEDSEAAAAVVAAGASDCVLLGLFLAGRRASMPWSRCGVAALGRLARVGLRRLARLGGGGWPGLGGGPDHGARRCVRRPAALALHRRRTAAAAPPSQIRRRTVGGLGPLAPSSVIAPGRPGGGAPGAEGVEGRGWRPGGGCVNELSPMGNLNH